MQFKSIIIATASLAASVVVAEQWAIKDFSRDCTNPDICTYYFNIDTGSATQTCTVVDEYTPAGDHSWGAVPCQENSNYHISWGYDSDHDFAVMTVVDQARQVEAFFGYDSPNSDNPVASYPDAGPSFVQDTGVTPVAVKKGRSFAA